MKDWLLRVVFGKTVMKTVRLLVQMVLAWLAAQPLEQYGITLDRGQFTAGTETMLLGIMEVIRNGMKHKLGWSWVPVAILALGLASAPAYADELVNDPGRVPSEQAAAIAAGAAGAATVAAFTIAPAGAAVGHAAVVDAMILGAYLEYTTDCARRGLDEYEPVYNYPGNGGNMMSVGGMASEERVKWEVGPNGWLRRKCQAR